MTANDGGGNVLGTLKHVTGQTLKEFIDDDCPRMAAALSYYTVFSLPPILVILLLIAGAFMSQEDALEAITAQAGEFVGSDAAGQIETMIQNAGDASGGILTTLLSIGALLFGATGALSQLQKTLNRAWGVEFSPQAGGIRKILFVLGKRLFSLAMVLVIAFLLLVSLVLNTLLHAFRTELAEYIPLFDHPWLAFATNILLLLSMTTLLFAAIFKILPDARLSWRNVWRGAITTAILFVAGMQAFSIYIGRSDPGSTFGAAGALVVILVWVYVSALILFLGAEFTQVWVQRQGRRISPSRYAVHVVEEKRIDEEDASD